jgi:hypothetical protein
MPLNTSHITVEIPEQGNRCMNAKKQQQGQQVHKPALTWAGGVHGAIGGINNDLSRNCFAQTTCIEP